MTFLPPPGLPAFLLLLLLLHQYSPPFPSPPHPSPTHQQNERPTLIPCDFFYLFYFYLVTYLSFILWKG
ncbi:hypothetical protein E2C01_081538 [Portunus trituberculatus]|uniref:Secreted peptide n=1 Tax=Portunus trituberculatus TaxID=210409 RepID=A0A5B7IS58_PORTR|nr:hypothetical protein [Portunus trituberculatus]